MTKIELTDTDMLMIAKMLQFYKLHNNAIEGMKMIVWYRDLEKKILGK